jgi:hypothetical protein
MPEFSWPGVPTSTSSAGSGAGVATTQPIRRDFKLDDSGARVLDGNDFVFVYDAEAIAQAVRIRLRFVAGEWVFDPTKGTRWFDILGKKGGLDVARGILRDRILGTPGISALTALTLTLDAATRTLSVTWSAQTDVGALAEQQVEISLQ